MFCFLNLLVSICCNCSLCILLDLSQRLYNFFNFIDSLPSSYHHMLCLIIFLLIPFFFFPHNSPEKLSKVFLYAFHSFSTFSVWWQLLNCCFYPLLQLFYYCVQKSSILKPGNPSNRCFVWTFSGATECFKPRVSSLLYEIPYSKIWRLSWLYCCVPIKVCPFLCWLPVQTYHPQYLINLTNFKWRNAFTSLRYQTMESVMVKGWYQRITQEERRCPCGTNTVENLTHYLLACPIYIDRRVTVFKELGLVFNRSEASLIIFLLKDSVPYVSEKVACFALQGKVLRNKFLGEDV